MNKTKLNPAELQKSREKKLNTGRKAGFAYDLFCINNDVLQLLHENVSTSDLLTQLDNKGIYGGLRPLKPCICLNCDELAFKLLNYKTLWSYDPVYKRYIYYFSSDIEKLKTLSKNLYETEEEKQPRAILAHDVAITFFNRMQMLKFCPRWQNFNLSNLPKLTDSMVSHITALAEQLQENNDNYFLINKLTNKYRISQSLCGRLANSVLSLNTHYVLERLLQMMSHTSAILVNKDTDKPYKFDFEELLKPLKFKGRSTSKLQIATNALNNLVDIGIIDSYTVSDGDIYIQSAFITKHIRQQIHRTIGYFAGMTASKPYIATFINYLNWIINAHHEQLTIALNTLLHKLNLERLLKESRISEIAKILTELRNVAIDLKLLSPPSGESVNITATDVKYLLNNRTELHKYFILHNVVNGEEDK